MGNYVIEIAGLTVTRGGRLVIPGLDLRVPAGQVVGLLGPSGGGKSTVMRAVVGVQRIDDGDVEVLGLPAGHRRLRKRVGYVTQSPSVYGDLTVRENVTHFARLLGTADPQATAEAVVARVGLADHADDRTDELSGGQRSRASLAAALVGDPELLVLDEPTVGLDPVLRRDLWGLFRRLAQDGVTLLVSSHVMDEASRCDRLVLLREGVVLADDTPARLLERTGAEDAEGAFLALVEGVAA
ncbi:ABC transporter ATP-binding protein [Janibacter cremeus]|uniref:ABC transporter ATP-binding protein n=1 Tax=Janibacter cremeus TaxID=1285192 RepID=UPI0023F6E49D|nr:ABC transporter ATP-binding protein [Janibacter cremeus]WEV76705.1 ABC transporter ATP-binding protein [Janibacter cremeus]